MSRFLSVSVNLCLWDTIGHRSRHFVKIVLCGQRTTDIVTLDIAF